MKSILSILIISLFSAQCWAIECGPALVEVGKEGAVQSVSSKTSAPKNETLISSTNVYQINLKTAVGGTQSKRVRVLPKDDWGAPDHLKGKNFTVTIPIETREEGVHILQAIARASGLIAPTAEIDMADKRMGMAINPEVYASFHQAKRTPMNDGNVLELNLMFESHATAATAQNILAGLQKLGLSQTSSSSIAFNLNTYSGRREWGYYSFYEWSRTLSRDETKALRDLAGPDYREIHSALRKGEINSRWNATIGHLDQAIARGTLDRDITVWRASSQPELFKAWEQLRQSVTSSISLSRDPAFIFTTLSPEVADWWNSSQLSNKGIILEIRAPRGTHAGFIDAEGIMTDRGYQEVVFPRNMGSVAIEAKIGTSGKPILVVQLKHPN